MRHLLCLLAVLSWNVFAAAPPDHLATVDEKPIATYAVYFSAPEKPQCIVPLAGKSWLVPKELAVPLRDSSLETFSLPTCDPTQTEKIAELAKNPQQKYAVVQGLVVPLCAFNFILSAAAVAAANTSRNPVLTENVTGFALGYGTAMGVAKGVDALAKATIGAVGFACSAVGAYVGYMIVPGSRFR
jgi:hypothetical protein